MADNEIRGTENSRSVPQPKLCPFCGEEASIFGDVSTGTWNVYCGNGLCPGRPGTAICFSEQEAIEAWNTRCTELVRCRDCKYEVYGMCMRLDENGDDYMRFQIEPDGFCKWGERRSE